MKLLRYLNFLLLLFISGGMFAQQSSTPSKYTAPPPLAAPAGADQMLRVPISVAAFLALDSEAQRNVNSYQFTDLAQTVSTREDGKFYLTEEQFYTSDEMRKMKVLQAPNTYVVVANNAAKPKIHISQSYLNSLSPEKQTAILNSSEYEVGQ